MKSKISNGMNKIKLLSSKIKFRAGLKTIPYMIISILVGVTAVYATSKLTPPDTVSNTMYSLSDIYNLASGTTTTEGTGTIPTTPSLSETGKTLTEVYTAISTEIAKLSSSVIASGTSAFGITGDTDVVDTSSGDATENDILTGKKAWVDGVEVTGMASAGGGVTKTGQTICYNVAGDVIACTDGGIALGGQDGYYSTTKGTTLSYTDNGNVTITDNVTGLMWKKCSEGKTGNNCETGSNNPKTWTEALAVCEADTTATFTDWRLPNMRELTSLVDYGTVSPAMNPLFFAESDGYWSSTTYLGNPTSAWVVFFYGGNANGGGKTSTFYVRCVRG